MRSRSALIELAAAEQDLDHRLTGDRGQERDRDHDEDQQPQGPGEQTREGTLATDRGLARQRWQDHDPERDADDPERDLEQGEGEAEVGDGALAERAGQRGHDDERDLGHPQPDRAGCHQDQRLAGLCVARVDPGRVAETHPREWADLDEQVAERAQHDAEGQTLDAEARPQDERATDDRQVVDDGRDRRRGEPTVGVEDARGDRPHREEDRAEQHDPGQLDGPIELRDPRSRG